MGHIRTCGGSGSGGGRLGEAYGEEVAAVGDVSEDGEGVGVRDGGGDGSEVMGVEEGRWDAREEPRVSC
jgi:hypothetical protein